MSDLEKLAIGTEKISEMTPAVISKNTDLIESSVSNGMGGYTTYSQTLQNVSDLVKSNLNTYFLQSSNNLSDVQSASTSRSNLGINFQNTYSLGSTFNLSSSGFEINNSLGSPLLDFSTSDGINFGVALYAQNNIALSNATTGSFTQFNGNTVLNYTNLDAGANNPNFTFTAKSKIPSNTFATAGNYQFGFSDESSSPSGFFQLSLIDGGINNPILYASGVTTSAPPLVSMNSQVRIGSSFSPVSANLKLLLNGTDSSTTDSPAIGFFTNTDGYPIFQLLSATHGITLLNFDCYSGGGTVRSSSAGSNFQIAKTNNQLQFNFNSGTSPGSGFGFNQAGYFDTSGNLTLSRKLIVGNPSGSTNALAQFNSGQYGILPPNWDNTQESNNVALLGSIDSGLRWFNSTTSTQNFWNGSALQQILTFQNLQAGSNIIFDDSTPGIRVVNATGGGTSPTAAFASWSIQNNSVTTTAQSSFGPVGVAPDGSNFFDINSSNFTNQIMMVSGIYTVISTYVGSNTQYFVVDSNFGIVNGASSNQTYILNISVLQSGGSVVSTNAQMSMTFPNSGSNLPESLSGIVQLNTGDSVLIQIRNTSGGNNCNVSYINFKVSNIAGSIPNTNSLSQGSNNLYLSQNGGSSFQNISGSLVPGNLVEANTSGGQLIDSGIPATAIFRWVVVTTSTQQMQMNTGYIVKNLTPVTFTLPPTNSSIGSFEIVGTGTATWSINLNSGQYVEYNGLTTTVSSGSVSSGTSNDSARIIYAGDNSGEFNIELSNGMSLTLS